MRGPKRSLCPISLTLEIVGDRWSLLILRDLILRGKQRYGEFLQSPEAISTNILADRLSRLEERGLVRKSADPDSGKQFLYAATRKGMDFLPVLLELVRWGMKYQPHAKKLRSK